MFANKFVKNHNNSVNVKQLCKMFTKLFHNINNKEKNCKFFNKYRVDLIHDQNR